MSYGLNLRALNMDRDVNKITSSYGLNLKGLNMDQDGYNRRTGLNVKINELVEGKSYMYREVVEGFYKDTPVKIVDIDRETGWSGPNYINIHIRFDKDVNYRYHIKYTYPNGEKLYMPPYSIIKISRRYPFSNFYEDLGEDMDSLMDGQIRVPKGQTDTISFSEIKEGTPMVDFHNEREKYHRYYTEETYNSLKKKENPFTNKPIDSNDITKYVAKLDPSLKVQEAGRRKTRRRTRSKRTRPKKYKRST